LRLIVDLIELEDVPRFPLQTQRLEPLAGLALPVLSLAPFEASAPLKLQLALQRTAR
jgi:hypothetical protein